MVKFTERMTYGTFMMIKFKKNALRELLSNSLLRHVLTGLKTKTRFLSFQRVSSTQKKKLAKRKLSFWEYVFGPERSSKNPCASQLINCQEQTRRKQNLHYQMILRNVPIYTDFIKSKDSRRLVEPQPKPPPSYKLPKAVLLNRAMVEGFLEGDETYEDKTLTLTTPRKPYEEMKPALNTKKIIEHQRNVRVEDKFYKKSTSRMSKPIISLAKARDTTTKILRQAMAQEEPPMHSRTERLKILVNEKVTKSIADRFGT